MIAVELTSSGYPIGPAVYRDRLAGDTDAIAGCHPRRTAEISVEIRRDIDLGGLGPRIRESNQPKPLTLGRSFGSDRRDIGLYDADAAKYPGPSPAVGA
ncbi:hypothetical protein [Sphingomonas prati]|uniref:Uncharacterized protein n=1 Tax=Sphingomonas prati TaxID=1843237 RepID=A0A7W9BRC0_9SPHN|nr:hypothetical protein [Sphingomonas prati]MBB5728722.1 hypothetical protein [Sphingomonas prati]GGE71617.1 hypothetical protein GCM10011404_00080 [Sphingomonas prati]